MVKLALGAIAAALLLSGCGMVDSSCSDGNAGLRFKSELCYLAGGWYVMPDKSLRSSKKVERTHLLLGFPLWVNAIGGSPKVNGVAFSPLLLCSPEVVNGVAIAPVHWTEVNGVSIGPLVAAPVHLNGLSSALLNLTNDGRSAQLGVMNYRGWMGRGSTEDARGLFQIGVVNRDTMRGSDVLCGIVNVSDDVPYFQLGLVNVADKRPIELSASPAPDTKEKEQHFYIQLGLCNFDGGRGLPFLNLGW